MLFYVADVCSFISPHLNPTRTGQGRSMLAGRLILMTGTWLGGKAYFCWDSTQIYFPYLPCHSQYLTQHKTRGYRWVFYAASIPIWDLSTRMRCSPYFTLILAHLKSQMGHLKCTNLTAYILKPYMLSQVDSGLICTLTDEGPDHPIGITHSRDLTSKFYNY
jgi:hypothetical protein